MRIKVWTNSRVTKHICQRKLRITLDVEPYNTIKDVRALLQEKERRRTGRPKNKISNLFIKSYFMFAGEELEEGTVGRRRTLRDYHIENGATLDLLPYYKGSKCHNPQVLANLSDAAAAKSNANESSKKSSALDLFLNEATVLDLLPAKTNANESLKESSKVLQTCSTCSTMGTTKIPFKLICSCHSTVYCSNKCQRKHWKQHKHKHNRICSSMKLVDHLLCFDEMIQEEKAIVEVFISYGNTRTEAEKMSQDSRDTLKLIKQDLSKSLLINKTFSLLLIRECATFDADLGPWYRMPEDWTNGDAVRSLFKTMTAKETVLSSVLSVRDAKIPIKLCAEFQEKLDKIVAAMEQESQALLRGYPAAGGIKGEIRMLKKGWKPSWSMSPWPLDPLKKLSFAKSFGTDCDCVTDEWLTLAVRSGKCSQLTFLEL